FFGNGAPPSKPSGGIRVIGEDHTIVNNYFERTSGINGGVINLTAGIPDSPLKGYWQIKKCLVANNTFVDNEAPCIQLSAGFNQRNRTLLPRDVTIANNVMIPPTRNAKPLVSGTEGTGFRWEDNLTPPGSDIGSAGSSGFKLIELKMMRGEDGVMRREGEKPAAEQHKPLTPADVGPAWRQTSPRAAALPAGTTYDVILSVLAKDLRRSSIDARSFGVPQDDNEPGPIGST